MEFQITIENFKSIEKTTIELKQGLNILIGPNGAGKTNILTSLKFLKDTLIRGVGLAIAKGGGPLRSFNRGKDTIRFTISFDYGNRTFGRRPKKTTCIWIIEIEQRGYEKQSTITKEEIQISLESDGKVDLARFTIDRASLSKPTSTIYLDTERSGKDLFVINNQKNTRSKKEWFKSLEEELRKTFQDFRKQGDKSIILFVSGIEGKFSEIMNSFISLDEYNINPERARQATEQLPYAKMSPNGFGISEVIEALEKGNYGKIEFGGTPDFEYMYPYRYYRSKDYFYHHTPYSFYQGRRMRREINEALTNINAELSAAVKNISSVSVDIDQTNGRRFVVFKTNSSEKFYPDEVSDGTIKWLCILTGIYVGFSSIFLLEEPENFLHPWMQQKLIQIMREQAKKNNSVFLLTTHSTTLLNAAYPNEVITVSSPLSGTECKRIENIEEITAFLKNSEFRLGDLWVSGGLGAIPE
jgi:predicted ATPase